MTPASPPPESSSAGRKQIQRGRKQFIEKNFARYLHGDGPERAERLWSIHDALFVEGKPIDTVLREFAEGKSTIRVIAVTSGKGGVGKTTISVNLAVALALQGQRVLVFDADLGMANLHVFAGLNPKATVLDVVEGRASLGQIILPGPAGVHFACGASGTTRLADLLPTAVESLCRNLVSAAQAYNVLLLDTGAGISRQVMKFLALATETVVVTTPNTAAILDAYGMIKSMREAGLTTKTHVLVNQTDELAQADEVYGRICACAERFLQFTPASLGALTRDRAVEDSNQNRLPLALGWPGNPNAARLAEIAVQFAGCRPKARESVPDQRAMNARTGAA